MGLEDLNHNFLTGSLEKFVNWSRKSSTWPASFGLACCAIEMMNTVSARNDLSRFGDHIIQKEIMNIALGYENYLLPWLAFLCAGMVLGRLLPLTGRRRV